MIGIHCLACAQFLCIRIAVLSFFKDFQILSSLVEKLTSLAHHKQM